MPVKQTTRRTSRINRISISLPLDPQDDVDDMVTRRGFNSRSHAINDMRRQQAMAAVIPRLHPMTNKNLIQRNSP